MDADTLLFFSGHENALSLYAAFEEKLYERFPETGKRVQKTQITFVNRHVFACVSFARVRKKKEGPGPSITVTLGLPYPLMSDRVAIKTEVYPGRFTTHIPLSSMDEINEELISWVEEAYAFAASK